jgi:hypothetical protein
MPNTLDGEQRNPQWIYNTDAREREGGTLGTPLFERALLDFGRAGQLRLPWLSAFLLTRRECPTLR